MADTGFVLFHRKIEDWEWYTEPNVFRLFFHLVLKANHEDYKWKGQDIKRGQLITSSEHLALQLKLGRQQIRNSLNKLKSTNEITIKSTNKFTIVTIANYNVYQEKKKRPTNKPKENQPTTNQQPTTNNNDNNENNTTPDLKIVYADFVTMKKVEYEKLVESHGEVGAKRMIEILDNYKGANGKKYASDYMAILNWVVKRYMEEGGSSRVKKYN